MVPSRSMRKPSTTDVNGSYRFGSRDEIAPSRSPSTPSPNKSTGASTKLDGRPSATIDGSGLMTPALLLRWSAITGENFTSVDDDGPLLLHRGGVW
eukprot:504-Prymnesium_polylepis.2